MNQIETRPHPTSVKNDQIIIIGAGVAGLTLARCLRSIGVPFRLLEARDRVGGRLDTVEHGGVPFDLGATWVWESETAVRGLLRELDLQTYESHRGGIDLVETSDRLERVRLPGSPVAEFRVDGGTAAIARSMASTLPVETSRAVRGIEPTDDGVAIVLDHETIRGRAAVFAAPPPLLGSAIEFEGASDDQLRAIARTPVWMGNIAKVVAIYDEPFWLADGLSGRVFSHAGPMVEIHDISGPDRKESPALFGFVPRSRAIGEWRAAVVEQLERLFGPRAAQPAKLAIRAWWDERETTPAGHEGSQQLMGHPFLRQPLLGGRVFLGSTETASVGAGHIEGAVRRATSLRDQLGAMYE